MQKYPSAIGMHQRKFQNENSQMNHTKISYMSKLRDEGKLEFREANERDTNI